MPLFHIKLEGPNTVCRVESKIEAQHVRLRNYTVENQAPVQHHIEAADYDIDDNMGTTVNNATKVYWRETNGNPTRLKVWNGTSLMEDRDVAANAVSTESYAIIKNPTDTVSIDNSAAGDGGAVSLMAEGSYDYSGYLVDLSDMFATTTREITSQSTNGAPGAKFGRESHARLHIPIYKRAATRENHNLNCGFDSHTLQSEFTIKVYKDVANDADNAVTWGQNPGELTAINLYFEYETNDNQH